MSLKELINQKIKTNMSNLMREVQQHLSDDVIMQLSRQVGAQDPNQVKSAAFNCAELLLNAISRNANSQERGSGHTEL